MPSEHASQRHLVTSAPEEGIIEIRELRSFVHVARVGSVSRAARELAIAQPALSRQIAKLED